MKIYFVQETFGMSKCSVKLSSFSLNFSTCCLWVVDAFSRIRFFCYKNQKWKFIKLGPSDEVPNSCWSLEDQVLTILSCIFLNDCSAFVSFRPVLVSGAMFIVSELVLAIFSLSRSLSFFFFFFFDISESLFNLSLPLETFAYSSDILGVINLMKIRNFLFSSGLSLVTIWYTWPLNFPLFTFFEKANQSSF